MSDIRDELNKRLQELRETAAKDVVSVRDGAAPTSVTYERASRNLAELREVEATLATMQLADAQRDVANAQREVADQQRVANEADARQRSTAEESAFWARRFLTSITIANVGGLVAVLVFLSKPDSPVVPLDSAGWAVRLFAAGTFLGGAYPLAKITALWIWRDRPRPLNAAVMAEFVIPGLATFALLTGTAIATGAVFDVYSARLDKPPAAPPPTTPIAARAPEPKSSASSQKN